MLKAIENNPQAYALIKGNKIEGTVSFFNMFDGTLMAYQISGLPTGEKENHAFLASMSMKVKLALMILLFLMKKH